MKKTLYSSIFLLLLLSACADKYLAFQSRYPFKSPSGSPDFSQLDYWAAHPWKKDPSDSIPSFLKYEKRDSLADVFFLHPTTFTKAKDAVITNALIDDAYINAKTDYSTILYQASVFNQQSRVFAPRYRQAHIQNFYSGDTLKSKAAFELAYADIKAAFIYYLAHYNQGRPIIIAGHSQGAFLSERLLKEFFENKSLAGQLVAAYIIGWPVPGHFFSAINVCSDSLQTGCFCSWRTFRKGYRPPYLYKETDTALVTNPLSWTTGPEFISRKQNKGALVRYNKLYRKSTDAQIKEGLLYTRKPRFPWSFLYRSKNYHVGDINLYYMDIRHNVAQRIAAYLKQTKQ
ncbi:MAG: DUF3089 domain-containing protein [Chitinophagaceae bacterium]|nr:DUF3089 domain-containing protein [Chitinophagaceae bacterium]